MELYERAELYDIAFSYRDIGAEVDVVKAWYEGMTGHPRPARVLELGAGPARHARELARRGSEAWALDMSPAMSDYARAQAVADGVRLEVVTADMTAFELPRRFDLILLMINSAAHLLTESAMVRHLECVARTLTPGGVYVMEVAHPADDEKYPNGEPPRQWTVQRGQTTVDIRLGTPGDPIDQQSRVRTTTVELKANIAGRHVSFEEKLPMRAWKKQAIDEAIQRAGGFGAVRVYGDFAPDAAFERPDAWRMVYVMQRAGGPQR
ncbi:class I SAM-dependent methyltransferase [Archangium violaceum]|uniref:class I SAM-dependent methyltransferase n=1 Tax=Archangium violaceum TaxID=83451 RepID=UPI0019502B44|nr:class I SAM-dependent methyltransferase [Archangium violaceum]QRN93400.1 class I SAM-dependent methyltransferase [Archangium violaceum]